MKGVTVMSNVESVSTDNSKRTRKEIVAALRERDGDICRYPGCEETLDFSATGRKEPTVDHRTPQSKARERGWTEDQIWALANLDLMHKACNAKKSDLEYRPDGTLPEKPMSRFKQRRIARSERPDSCDTCFNGRILLLGETCPDCDSGPQPSFPTAYQRKSSECPHAGPYSCWSCMLGYAERKPAYIDVFDIENTGIED